MSQRFLISRLSALGDVVCTLPSAVALKRTFPDCEVVWAVDSRFQQVVQCCNSVDRIVKISRKGPSPELDELKETEFDVAFDLQGLMKSALVVARTHAKRKLGYHWQREGSGLFSERVLPDPSSLHVVDQYVDVVRAAGAVMDRAEFAFEPKAEALDKMRQLLTEFGEGPVVLLNAGAGWASKRWPPTLFAALVDALAADGLMPVFIGSGSADEAAFQEISRLTQTQPASAINRTDIGELIALISQASVHVGGDTGSSHIAAALGIPAVGLYSTTRPDRSCPYGQIARCHYDPDSMANISVESVLRTVTEALN